MARDIGTLSFIFVMSFVISYFSTAISLIAFDILTWVAVSAAFATAAVFATLITMMCHKLGVVLPSFSHCNSQMMDVE